MMKKNQFIYILNLLFFILILLSIFSSLQIYQRFVDLNSSIINGVDLAVKNGVLLSDLRGSVRDIADSYVKSGVMASSYLFSDVNQVSLSQQGKNKCDISNIVLHFHQDKNVTVSLSIDEDNSFYFCFKNNFYVQTVKGNSEIAYWTTGFQITKQILFSYLKHIIIFSIIFSIVILILIYLLMKKLEESRRREMTIDIARKVKHEIVRPIAKMEAVSDDILNNSVGISKNEILSRLYCINVMSKSYKLIVRSMFSYVLNKENLESILKNDPIKLCDVIDKSIDISIKSKNIKMELSIQIDQFLKEKWVCIDETFLSIAISNLLTNAYEAVCRNKMDHLKIEISSFYKDNSIFIRFKNYGSFILKEKQNKIFNPGVTGSIATNSGYGLAILKDIVDLYHGDVSVESENEGSNIQQSWTQFSIKLNNINTMEKNQEKHTPYHEMADVCRRISNLNLKILIADDDISVIDQFKKMIKFIDSDSLKVDYFFDLDNDYKSVSGKFYDFVIVDLKFYDDEEYGYSLIKMVRKNNPESYIVVHSSSFFEDIQEKFLKLELNEFVQKTMTFSQFVTLIGNSAKRKNKDELTLKKEFHFDKINVLVIDDEPHLYEDWKILNKDCNFIVFSNFDELFDQIDLHEIDISKIHLVITDFYFDKVKIGMNLFTSDYIGTLKDIYDYQGPIVLATNGAHLGSPLLNGTIEKKPIVIRDLICRLRK